MTSPDKSDMCQYLTDKGRDKCLQSKLKNLDLILNSGEKTIRVFRMNSAAFTLARRSSRCPVRRRYTPSPGHNVRRGDATHEAPLKPGVYRSRPADVPARSRHRSR